VTPAIQPAGPEARASTRYGGVPQAYDSNSLPLPPLKYPSSTMARGPSPIPGYSYSTTGTAGGAAVAESSNSNNRSPTPPGGSGGLALQLNPTTLAMLQQHNYIPYFRGTRAGSSNRRTGGDRVLLGALRAPPRISPVLFWKHEN